MSELDKNHPAKTSNKESIGHRFRNKIKFELQYIRDHFKNLSIHRQSNIIVGVFLFLSIIAGDNFLQFVITIFSLALVFSGITGQYVSHKILKKMPWNKKN